MKQILIVTVTFFLSPFRAIAQSKRTADDNSILAPTNSHFYLYRHAPPRSLGLEIWSHI
jgi:hypothetical protein